MKILNFTVIFLAAIIVFSASGYAGEVYATGASGSLGDRAQRFENAVKRYPIRLSEKEQMRLASRCTKAQQYLSKIHDKLDVRAVSITRKYSLIELHLSAVQKRLAGQQIDTSIIDLLLANFQSLDAQYQVALNEYHNALGDVSAVDCTLEPQTFRALLEEVRAKRRAFVNSIEAIKDFSEGDLKTGFDSLRVRINNRSEEL